MNRKKTVQKSDNPLSKVVGFCQFIIYENCYAKSFGGNIPIKIALTYTTTLTPPIGGGVGQRGDDRRYGGGGTIKTGPIPIMDRWRWTGGGRDMVIRRHALFIHSSIYY